MNTKKIISVLAFTLTALACIIECILSPLRGYGELFSTILVFSVVILLFSLVGLLKNIPLLYLLSGTLGIVGCILLIGFPSYVCYFALVLFPLSFVLSSISLMYSLCRRRKQEQ